MGRSAFFKERLPLVNYRTAPCAELSEFLLHGFGIFLIFHVSDLIIPSLLKQKNRFFNIPLRKNHIVFFPFLYPAFLTEKGE